MISPLHQRLQVAWSDPRGLGAHLDVNGDGPVDSRDAEILEQNAAELGRIADFAAAHARMSEVLGSPVRGKQVEQATKLELGDRITSEELIRRLESSQIGLLRERGLRTTAVFDFDETLMHGDVVLEFAALAAAKKVFLPEANPLVVDRLLAGLPPERDRAAARAGLLARPVEKNVQLALELFDAGKLKSHTAFTVTVAALAGQTEETVTKLARELFERGAPGKAPYKTHLFGKREEKSSALDLVDALSSHGVECHLVTAGLELVARVGAEYVGIPPDRVIGSELKRDADGRFTGEVMDMVALGKDQAVLDRIGVPPLFAFGDNPLTDGPMLRLATVRGVIVGDRPAFRALDRKHGLGHLELAY